MLKFLRKLFKSEKVTEIRKATEFKMRVVPYGETESYVIEYYDDGWHTLTKTFWTYPRRGEDVDKYFPVIGRNFDYMVKQAKKFTTLDDVHKYRREQDAIYEQKYNEVEEEYRNRHAKRWESA